MDYNYHTHTKRCGHATGSVEEYIKKAIDGGIKYMGFSEHIPLRSNDGFEASFRLPTSEGKAYIDEIKDLREKYSDRLDIKVGFEMEYYPEEYEKMLNTAKDLGAEYLILGQHYLGREWEYRKYIATPTDRYEDLVRYTGLVIEGMKKGVFTYVAHPDVINFTGDRELYIKEMRKLCLAANEMNIPLEINFLGIYQNRSYPTRLFWEIAREEKTAVTFGFDAHDPERAYDTKSLAAAEKIVKELKLNYIGRPSLVLL